MANRPEEAGETAKPANRTAVPFSAHQPSDVGDDDKESVRGSLGAMVGRRMPVGMRQVKELYEMGRKKTAGALREE